MTFTARLRTGSLKATTYEGGARAQLPQGLWEQQTWRRAQKEGREIPHCPDNQSPQEGNRQPCSFSNNKNLISKQMFTGE